MAVRTWCFYGTILHLGVGLELVVCLYDVHASNGYGLHVRFSVLPLPRFIPGKWGKGAPRELLYALLLLEDSEEYLRTDRIYMQLPFASGAIHGRLVLENPAPDLAYESLC